jgi:hypothetical protein
MKGKPRQVFSYEMRSLSNECWKTAHNVPLENCIESFTVATSNATRQVPMQQLAIATKRPGVECGTISPYLDINGSIIRDITPQRNLPDSRERD